jgi:hypothetical protein
MGKYFKAHDFSNAKDGDLRVWWIPQVGAKIPTFRIPVNTIREAKLLLDTLAFYDLYQLDNRIKPDYANTGELECYEKGDGENMDWYEWHNDDGEDIDHVDDNGNTLQE